MREKDPRMAWIYTSLPTCSPSVAAALLAAFTASALLGCSHSMLVT